ncbi:MAG: hypothetical protein IPP99_18585 [Chitinophagaceae bacterium]|nr:hypothetical protein [Chitinophagaceae bacterium]
MRITGKIIATGSLITLFFPAVGLPLSLTILGIGTLIMFIGDGLLFYAADDFSEISTDELLLETLPSQVKHLQGNLVCDLLMTDLHWAGNIK